MMNIVTATDVQPPSEVVLHVTVKTETLREKTQLRGRLTGPICLGQSTIEVAYPLRGPVERQGDNLSVRMAIPEASLWEPERPFLYRLFVELWEDGLRADRQMVTIGFRSGQVSSRGVRWNGFPLTVKGSRRRPSTDEEALELRRSGVNLLLADVEDQKLWHRADRIGLLLLGTVTPRSVAEAGVVSRHPCFLGWVVPSMSDSDPQLLAELRQLGHSIVSRDIGEIMTGIE
jgi:hypothetical protein